MLDFLYSLDVNLLKFINITADHPILTSFFSTITNAHKLWPVQALLVGLFLWVAVLKRKKSLKFLFALILTAGLSDAIAYHGIKKNSYRSRPHHIQSLGILLKAPYTRKTGGPKSSSFPSNHSMTSFALASTISFYFPAAKPVVFGLASAVALSRVYLGVHYPSDILAGMIMGLTLAYFLIQIIFRRFLRV